ncbi:unnamed protein product [Rhizoctonia solani]|uniref:Laminin domain protein n=1 Tax=Rhizoctonia solani TaxID=456999 RepID=A0A8H3E7C5_9AGAM|nr:unnamed protein product [Rhizoctonia solani]CAE7200253.1 unnamed protein product [Rhizoctonia solani]
MTSHSTDQVLLPPELPSYLKSVKELKPIVGAPNNDQLIGILSIIRVAQKAAEIPGMGDPVLISRLSEHLFDAQMARYRTAYLATTFPENTTYTPPTLPAHVPVQLELVAGIPSEAEIIRVQDAIRLYHQFSNAPSMFDPHANMELAQHLFDLQMARHMRRARQTHAPQETSSTNLTRTLEQAAEPIEERDASATNNPGTGAGVVETVQPALDERFCDAIERSNRLAEQANELTERANLLIERSNMIAERSNQLVEKSSQPVVQSNEHTDRFNQLFERLNQHMERSTQLAEQSSKPVEKLGEVLVNINRVLVKIQHAIIRNHRGNTTKALDCLVNEKGETPAMSRETGTMTFVDFLRDPDCLLSVVIDGVHQETPIYSRYLGAFLRFYGLSDALFKDASSLVVRPGYEDTAQSRLEGYLSSCLG